MTWKDFKDKCEMQGIKDDDNIWYIDISDKFFECQLRDGDWVIC